MLGNRTVKVLLEDRLDFVELELGLEAVGIGRKTAAVRAATGIGEVEAIENCFIASFAPIVEETLVLGSE